MTETEEPEETSTRRKKTTPTRKWLRRGVIGFVTFSLVMSLSLMIFMFVSGISIFYISGDSMEPYLHNGESVVLQQADEIEEGQIIFVNKPGSWFYQSGDSELLVKRVLAVPGDEFSFDGEAFSVNGEVKSVLPEGYDCSLAPQSFKMTLGKTQHFIVGDNVENSFDSRKAFCTGNVRYSFLEKFRIVDYGKIIMRF